MATQLAFSLDEAITKSGTNHIIYAPGGSFAIGDIDLSKKVTIIGVGHHPDSAQATGRNAFDGNIRVLPEASGSTLIGFFYLEV